MWADWKKIPYTETDERLFHAGGWQRWAESFPMLFDEDDQRRARGQADQRWFFEWLAARTIYEETGHRSLIAQYASKSHPKKWLTFQRVAPPEVVALLTERRRFGYTLGPDLFVYDHSGWFFAEVKSPTDRRRESQDRLFVEVEKVSGRQIRLVTFRDEDEAN